MAFSPRQFGLLVASLVLLLGFAAAQSQENRPKGDVTRGEAVFADNCEDCHYPDSQEEKAGPGLKGLKNGKLPDGRKVTHDVILDIINTGPAEMTAFKDLLSEQQKEDVVAYVLTL